MLRCADVYYAARLVDFPDVDTAFAKLAGYKVRLCIPRLLPFTTKSRPLGLCGCI
ncbi:MAG: hypothetical protein K2P45_04865 [Eubacterium sp.]|nr:hypothetical protein [Eubacterium sp.]